MREAPLKLACLLALILAEDARGQCVRLWERHVAAPPVTYATCLDEHERTIRGGVLLYWPDESSATLVTESGGELQVQLSEPFPKRPSLPVPAGVGRAESRNGLFELQLTDGATASGAFELPVNGRLVNGLTGESHALSGMYDHGFVSDDGAVVVTTMSPDAIPPPPGTGSTATIVFSSGDGQLKVPVVDIDSQPSAGELARDGALFVYPAGPGELRARSSSGTLLWSYLDPQGAVDEFYVGPASGHVVLKRYAADPWRDLHARVLDGATGQPVRDLFATDTTRSVFKYAADEGAVLHVSPERAAIYSLPGCSEVWSRPAQTDWTFTDGAISASGALALLASAYLPVTVPYAPTVGGQLRIEVVVPSTSTVLYSESFERQDDAVAEMPASRGLTVEIANDGQYFTLKNRRSLYLYQISGAAGGRVGRPDACSEPAPDRSTVTLQPTAGANLD